MNAPEIFNEIKQSQQIKDEALSTFSLFSKSKAIIFLNIFLQNNQ